MLRTFYRLTVPDTLTQHCLHSPLLASLRNAGVATINATREVSETRATRTIASTMLKPNTDYQRP